MYTEQEIEEYFIRPALLTTRKACEVFTKVKKNSKKRILLDPEAGTLLFDRDFLQRLSGYIKNTLKVYDELSLSNEEIKSINEDEWQRQYEKETTSISKKEPTPGRLVDLYLMQNVEIKDLKIGISNDSCRRQKELQNTSGRQIEILYVIPQKSNLELTLHEKFSHLRLMGEWFKYDKSIIDEFEKLLNS